MKKPFIYLMLAVSVLFFANQAYAYIDPGTGSMIVQAIIAVIAGVSVSLGIFRRRVAFFFNNLFNRKNEKKHDSSEK